MLRLESSSESSSSSVNVGRIDSLFWKGDNPTFPKILDEISRILCSLCAVNDRIDCEQECELSVAIDGNFSELSEAPANSSNSSRESIASMFFSMNRFPSMFSVGIDSA